MIKTAFSGAAGVDGNIHTLASGTTTGLYTSITTGEKVATSTTSAPANPYIYVKNSTSSINDYDGNDAAGIASLTFGVGNTPSNTTYINSLRGALPPVAEPTVQASNVFFSNVTSSALLLNWTNGNGSGRLVLAKAGSPVDAVPVDGTTYTPNDAFGTGSQIGTGNFVVSANSPNSVNVTGLTPGTTYYFAVFEYNGCSTPDYLTTSPATGSQATFGTYTVSGHVQTTGAANVQGVTISISGGPSTLTATTDAGGNYSFLNIPGGVDYAVTPSSAGFNFTPLSVALDNLSADQANVNFTSSSNVLISEFRFRGVDPDGGGPLTSTANEFVELYNNSNFSTDISGAVLTMSTGAVIYTVPASTTIPAGGHYLIGGLSYGLTGYASPNGTFVAGTDIPDDGGVALFTNSNLTIGNRLDAAGFSGAPALYIEGIGLLPAGGITTDGEFTFVRKLATGRPTDTDNNNADFDFAATDAGTYSGRVAILGAPNPENLTSPVINGSIGSYLLDGSQPATSAPNRVRSFPPVTNGPLGTLAIRRSFLNSTGKNVNTLRFQIIDVTTLHSCPACVQADLRVLSSSPGSVVVNGNAIPIQGLTLDTPPTQTIGGGMYSTVSAGTITTGTPLADGQVATVEFLLGVQSGGNFRFFVNVQAVTSAPLSASEHLVMGNPSNATVDVNQPANYLLSKAQYAVSYNRDAGRPNWVSWHLDSTWIGGAQRQNDFRNDPSLPAGWYQVQGTDYSGSGFDRGHHCPSADRTSSIPDNSATFFMTNMMPQAPDNNQGPWEQLESYSRTLVAAGNELYIIAGGAGSGGTGSNGGVTTTVAGGHVTVPNYTWKVIIVLPAQGGNDVNRVTNSTRVIAVNMPNAQGIRNNDWKTYRVSARSIENLTGYNFFSNVPQAIQDVIETQVDNQ
jgi:endonuclease G